MENQSTPVQPTSAQLPQQPAVAMQIQELLAKQQQLQGQYNQIVARLQANPNQTPEKIQEVKNQLDQLNTLYLQGQQQLQTLGYTPVQINKPTVVKEGAKNNFSYKKLAIGCSGFLLLLGGLFALTLMSLVKNPTALSGVGINAATAVNLLSIFAGLIVGVIGLVGLGVLLTNIYRLITVKNQSKIGYILGLIGSFLILGVAGGVAGVVFGQIGKISVEPVVKSTNLIDPYLVGKSTPEPNDPNKALERLWGVVPPIAPADVRFSLNLPIWNTELAKLGEITPQKLTLNCGNPQNQQLNYNNGFNSFCFYDKKWDYSWTAILTYDNKITGEKGITTELARGTLSFVSEIQLFLAGQNAKSSTPLSATQGEINLGKAPSKISVDAMAVFRSFGLPDYQIVRDMDGDNVNDRETPQFDYIYKKAQVYHPTVKFPGLSDFFYSFPVRVEPSDVPICEIVLSNFSQTKYKIQTNFLEGSVSTIAGYTYRIIDTSTQKELTTLKNSTREVDYTFPEKGNYLVLLDFITVDGKRGACESDVLQLAKEEITAKYVIRQKLSGMSSFTEVPLSAFSGNTITFDTIPQAISLDLTAVSPDSASMQKNIFVDGKPILNQGTSYEFALTEERTYEVVISLEDVERSLKREIPLHFVVKKPDIVGKLTFSPDTWYEPLKVRFDASQSILNIPGDEIIYFSRDFGDGETRPNFSNGVIEHTYTYDRQKENGFYSPKVVLTTKKGYSVEVQPATQISVKKQLVQVELTSPSHPQSQAKTGVNVKFLADFNGLPETMKWDFGDGSTPMQCKGRTCAEIDHTFEKVGRYTVKLTLVLEDLQSMDTLLPFNVY